MKSLCLSILLPLIGLSVSAQFIDTFADGDFTNNPSWQGDTDRFAVVSGRLQLQDNDPGSANERYLSVAAPTGLGTSTSWEFFSQLDFAPSGSNFARVYLASDRADLLQDLNGYYVQIGGISGSDDAVELFRQDGSSTTLLLSGQAGAVGSAPAVVRVRVTRSAAGLWTLATDYSGAEEGTFTEEGTIEDTTYDRLDFFGVYARYTSTRNTAIAFDDFLIDPLFQDEMPPELLAIQVLAGDSIQLQFNEPISNTSASNPANFRIDESIQPGITTLSSPQTILLELDQELNGFQTYELTIQGLSDAFGNELDTVASFTYIPSRAARPGDLVLTEFLADPSPMVGLPNAEFIELYNASSEAINLEGLGLASGGNPQSLPAFEILPDSYLIICDEDDLAAFSVFGPAVAIPSLPSLSNGGDQIQLTDQQGKVLIEINYTDDWYDDPNRDDGGYSLEFVDFLPPFQCPGKWGASRAEAGGTPGQANSLLGVTLDTVAPQLLAAVFDGNTVVLRFDAPLDTFDLAPTSFQISPDLIVNDLQIEADGQQLRLQLATGPQTGVLYELSSITSLMDCAGNAASENLRIELGVPESPQTGEVVVNEILFNPVSGGVDFVEIINRTEKIFDLNGWLLLNTLQDGGNNRQQITESRLLLPNDILVITADPAIVQDRFRMVDPTRLVAQAVPTLADGEGNISIRAADGTSLDSVTYTRDWHSELLRSQDGVSLERISPAAPSQSAGSWTSAASTVGFGTPTQPNSQFRENLGAGTVPQLFQLVDETFSPDGDGFEDVLLIEYETPTADYFLRLRIFDAQGRPVRQFNQLELLEGRGQLLWDGANDAGEMAAIGIYVLELEAFTPSGTTQNERLVAVLAGRLN